MEAIQEFGIGVLKPVHRTIPLSDVKVRFSVKFTKSGPIIDAAIAQSSKKYVNVSIENFPKNTTDPSEILKVLKERAIDYVQGKILLLPEDPLSLYDDWRARASRETNSSKKQSLLNKFNKLLPHVVELKKAQGANDVMRCAYAYMELGSGYTILMKAPFAIRCFHLCVDKLWQARVNPYHPFAKDVAFAFKIGHLCHDLGEAYSDLEDYERAIEFYKRGLDIFVQDKLIRDNELESCQKLGDAYQKLNQNHEANRYYQRSLKLAQKANDREGEARLYQKMGYAHFHQGENAEAVSNYCKVLALLEKTPNPSLEAKLHFNFGSLYHKLSMYRESNDHYTICVEMASKNGNDSLVQAAQSGLATNYVHTGELERVKELYPQQATELSFTNTEYQFRAFLNLSNVHMGQGQLKEALSWAHEAFKVAELSDNPKLQMYAYTNLETVYRNLGDLANARKYYELIEKITQKLPDVHKVEAFLALARGRQLDGNYEDALKCGEIALSFAQKGGTPLVLFNVYQQLSSLAFACHRYDEGSVFDLAAVDLANQLLLQNTKSDFQRSVSFFETLWRPFFSLATKYYLFALSKIEDSTDLLEQSLLYSDQYRSRALVERLGERLDSKLTSPLSLKAIQSAATRYQTTFVFYNAFSSELALAWYYVITPDQVHHGLLNLTNMQSEINFKKERPKYLRGDLSSSDERGVQLSESIAEWLTSIETNQEVTRTDPQGSAKEQPLKTPVMELWHKTLIDPLVDYLPKKEGHRVTIVPDAGLSSLPFAIFVDSKGKTLLDRYTLTVLPSIETLIRLEKIGEENAPKRSANKACILANPKSSMKPLNGAEKEGEQISKLFSEATLLKNEEATKAALLKSMPSANCIHLACHGVMTNAMEQPFKKDSNSVYQGALILANDELLYAEDVAELSLNADLAVLSACHSGKGNICKEGVVGLSHAFLAAGVTTVIGTHWGVADDSTQILMEAFYRYYLQDSTPSLQAKKAGRFFGKAEALRLAMLDVKEKYPKNIQRWGAFFLVGLP